MYGVREVSKLLRMSRGTIQGLVKAGFVTPERGPRNAWMFSFQDLIVLRTAQALSAASIPAQRITRSLKQLRRHLPEAMPLSGLSIGAVGDRVVVKEGARHWQADSGQYLLAFEGNLNVIERAAQDGCELHQAGRLREAEAAYRRELRLAGANPDPLLLYNLGVLLEDLGRKTDAMDSYEAALRGDPAMADCHYNLALLCEQLSRPREAIRHMAQYRKLVAKK
jgi:tetratricopeptide (TPR) repeat protein